MKPTNNQTTVLRNIELGVPVTPAQMQVRNANPGSYPLSVATFGWSRDGNTIVAHRTVVRDDATGDARLDYRTELYRVQRDGTTTRL